jgi:hypothetical protein
VYSEQAAAEGVTYEDQWPYAIHLLGHIYDDDMQVLFFYPLFSIWSFRLLKPWVTKPLLFGFCVYAFVVLHFWAFGLMFFAIHGGFKGFIYLFTFWGFSSQSHLLLNFTVLVLFPFF